MMPHARAPALPADAVSDDDVSDDAVSGDAVSDDAGGEIEELGDDGVEELLDAEDMMLLGGDDNADDVDSTVWQE